MTNLESRSIIGRATVITFWSIIAFELLSFSGFLFPAVNTVMFYILALATFAFSLRKLEYGVAIIFAEIVVGSKGYLFSTDIGGFRVSIRLALFLAVIATWGIALLRERHIEIFRLSYWKWFVAFVGVLALGAINGMLHGNSPSFLFQDVNGYLFFGLLPVLLQAIRNKESLIRLLRVISGGLLAGAAKVVVLLFLFSHNFVVLMPVVYRWIRITGVGEITRMDGNFYRIFFQSQIYDLLFVFFLLVLLLSQSERPRVRTFFASLRMREHRELIILFLATIMIVLLSWSRSFWLAGALTGIGWYLWLGISRRYRIRDFVHLSAILFSALIVNVVFLGILLNIPLDGRGWGGTSFFDLAKSRATEIDQEPAASSRFLLLPRLLERVKEAPFLGSGFGTTVTYTTQDPLFLESHPDGKYTAFAFEWGYLDMVTEVGLVGLMIFGIFLFHVFRDGVRSLQSNARDEDRKIVIGLLFGLTALLIVHLTTPYLNHPLGISFIVLCVTAFTILRAPSNGKVQ